MRQVRDQIVTTNDGVPAEKEGVDAPMSAPGNRIDGPASRTTFSVKRAAAVPALGKGSED